MELFISMILLIIGFVLLVKGADWFVDGAAGVAKKCNVPTLVIGLTIVAFGTSAPELCVSVTSALQHSTDIAIGNVLGSNIVNVLLILGISALLHDLPVQRSSLRLDLPVLILASALILGLGVWGNALSWWDGVIMLIVFAGYLYFLFRDAKKNPPVVQLDETSNERKGKVSAWIDEMKAHTWFLIVMLLVGLAMVVGGGTLLVEAAKSIARQFGVSERIIGLTVVAIGTSLPELVTSVIAAKKGETDIAVGNIIGSNIFNIFFVAGISSLFYPLAFTMDGNMIDAIVAFAAAVLLFVLSLIKGHKLGKPAGIIMLLGFIGYYIYLFIG